MSSTVSAHSNGVKAALTSLTAVHKTDLDGYKSEAGYEFKTGYTTEAVYKAEHGHKEEHHHHGHRDEHHHGHKEEHHHHGHKNEHHHGHKDEHHHCCSSEYGFSEDISVHFSEEHKQQLKTCTSSLGHVLSQVPWMKFRVVAEPDMNCFANDERLQIFMKKITEITVGIVTKQIREEVTEMISKLVTSILTTMTTRISAVQKVVFEHIEEIFVMKDMVTECESLCDIKGKICFGGERCTEKEPDCAPYDTEPKEPPARPPVSPKPTLPKEYPVSALPTAPKTPPAVALTNAKWIWTHDKVVKGGPPYSRPFRHVVHTDTPVDRLTINISCDNKYTLYVNGLLVGRGRNWQTPDSYTVSFEARKDVLIAVHGSEEGGTPVALIAAGKVWSSRVGDSIEKAFVTDKTWKTWSKDKFDTKFFELSYKDAAWEAATELHKYGEGVWSTLHTTQKGKDFERWTGLDGIQDAPYAPKAKIVL